MYYVYILYAPDYNKYYVGQTQDIEQRLLTHNELSQNSYTAKYRPWELKVYLSVPTRAAAIAMERHIKSKKRRAFLEAVIDSKNLREKLIEEFSGADNSSN